ncbi:protocadherin Fat 4-like [Pelodytes ibericus]
MKQGSIIGNIANDLDLDIKEFPIRKFQFSTRAKKQYFNISVDNGNLYVIDRIDRETICGMEQNCHLNLEIVMENPVNIFHIKIKIQDINDNSPRFSKDIFNVELSESAAQGTQIVLGNARDPDLGNNSLQGYSLTANQHFTLGEKWSTDGIKYPELILENTLDRERQETYDLILTAYDGGNPLKTGTALINIVITDVNDHCPHFGQDKYEIHLNENVPSGFLVLHLSATDEDEGSNAKITYIFSHISENALNVFTLDPQSGDIRTRGELDFETTKDYEMTVEAKDGGGLVAHCTVAIQIVDFNDNAPEIIIKSFAMAIPENSTRGTLVALININDPDSGENGEVTCQITDKIQFNLISLSNNYYQIITASTLDREKNNSYNITIVAEDGGSPPMSKIKTICLSILDVNDNPPEFDQSSYVAYVTENNMAGISVFSLQATDHDLNENSQILYSVRNTSIDGIPATSYVSINSETGIIYAQRSFDYETLREFQFQVMAKDWGSPPLFTNVTVVVQDINDNYPVFSQDVYRISMNEDAPSGSVVLRLNATDKDEGSSAQIAYSFSHISENPEDIFTLDTKTGIINTKVALDFETTKNYEMTVEARDGGGLVTHCRILIQIEDVNDNAPEILLESLFMPIPEDSLPGILIALIHVNDLDSGKNGEVTCQITEMLPFQLIPSSHNYYKLVTTGQLDRETIPIYNLTITAEDQGSPPMLTKKNLLLTVSDINDNLPAFERSNYITYVLEHNIPGASIHRVHASDTDAGENADILYSLIQSYIDEITISSYVSINSESGIIYAQRSFDYEQLREFNFQVMANDRGSPPLRSNVTVKICVIDKNDNAPKILYPSPDTDGTALFEFIPRSSEKGYLVTKVIAVDADSGHNAWLSYHLQQVPDSSYFTIGQYTGEIRIARDLQDTSSLREKIVVMVKDNGVPSLSATVTLNLVVAENFQQVLPEIVKHPRQSDTSSNVTFYLVISISLISLLFIITVIVTVIAKCRKSGNPSTFGSLSRAWYPQLSLNYPTQLSDGSLPLPYSYDLCVTLDSRQNEIAYLKPTKNVPTDNLIDTGDPATANDSTKDGFPSPSIMQIVCGQIQYSILEEIKPGSVIGNVAKHLGLDTTELFPRKLKIASHTKTPYFNISLENGNLYLIDRVDRETICEMEDVCLLNLEILAENPVNIVHVKIEILDINDNPPTFSKSIWDIAVSESALPGAHFALGKAHDPDLGSNALQSYNLTESQHFKLRLKNSTEGIKYPELVLDKALDREKQSSYDLTLTAYDGGKPAKTGTALVRIMVQDANDNYPLFTQDTYRISLPENEPIGTLVLQLNASDKDEGSNAQITFSFSHITEYAKDIFSLDAQNGSIKTIRAVDFEYKQYYEMTVDAKDGGGLVTHCRVLIQIVDINDNAPEILLASLSTPIPEDSLPRTIIALIHVSDLDSGKNGEVTCEITDSLLFKLIPSSNDYYQLVTAGSIDRETTAVYNITLLAKDEGSPPILTKKVIQLTIADVNDNLPVFDKLSYIAYVSENNLPGTSIHTVHASDIDAGENAQMLYSIFNSIIEDIPISSYISINSVTGVLYAQRSFDYEQLPEFQFQVMATDKGSPPLSNNITVRICIIDKNDHAPKILYPSPDTEGTTLFEFIPRSSKKGYLVTKVIAVDADSGHNAWLSYHLLEVSDLSFFIIGQHTGEIRIARDLQDTDSLRQKVVVMVKDNGDPSLSATVTIHLVVAENFQHVLPEIVKQPSKSDGSSNVTFYLVVSITMISMLFILTVVITIIAKCRKSNTPTSFGSLGRTWYPQLSLNPPSQFSDGSLPFPYSYDVCVTLDSTQNEIAYLRPVQNVPTDNLIDTGDSATGNDSTRNSFTSITLNQIASGQIQYSILEEMKQGSLVGNVAKDLGLDAKELPIRKLKIASHTKKHYFNISLENGNLYVIDRVDREAICEMEDPCILNLETLSENPVSVFHVKIEIQDINDNPPHFSRNVFNVTISESALPGTHFVLENARDADLGSNSLQGYSLTPNNHFKLGEKVSTDGFKYPELVLEKNLDREKKSSYEFILTAFDGGQPMKTGTALIKIMVQDINDNFPAFSQDIYRISLDENAPVGFVVLHLNATDEDDGANAQITYTFSHIPKNAKDAFSLDPQSGIIRTIGSLDFEDKQTYEMTVEAKDGGGLVTHCRVLIQIIDINDNAPEIVVASLSTPIPEDSLPGTLIALIHVSDLDSGKNGDVTCETTDSLLFKLIPSSNDYYQLVTASLIDRETTAVYNITLLAKDEGSPPILTKKVIQLMIADVNDNLPIFDKLSYIAYVSENNMPGTSIYSVHASDIDAGENAQMLYSILNSIIEDIPISSYISINSVTGVLYAQRSFDYEQLREFQFQVMAKDKGTPPLSNNITVRICIIDKNDNAPKILYPSPDTEGTSIFEFIPLSSEKGYLVTKVIAVDADSGHNGWLSYYLLEVSDSSFFIIGQQTGEIRIVRDLQDTDSLRHKVVVMVKDNGVPSLSATVTLSLVVAENFQQVLPEIVKQPSKFDTSSNATFYLVIAITLISLLFIVTVIVTVIAKCRKSATPTTFGSLSRPWYPQLSLKYPSQFSDGSLPFPYSYDVCVTLDSTQNEIAYLKPVQNVPTDNLIDTSDSANGNESSGDRFPSASLTQLQYSILEEIKQGSVVGNIAKDLGLDTKDLQIRKVQIASQSKRHYFNISLENGDLYVTDRIDREAICEMEDICLLNHEILAENPMSVFHVVIEIQDINDNAPCFSKNIFNVAVSESSSPGTQFVLENARDPDLGSNSLQGYSLTPNMHYKLREKISTEGMKYPELVLEKALDREKQSYYELVLTASDGGQPVKTGTALIKIVVQDANDNFPMFDQDTYRISLSENTPNGFLVLHLNASDIDDGSNAKITYSFSHIPKKAMDIFSIDPTSGYITTKGPLDFEVTRNFEMTVEAKDGGDLVTHCTVLIQVVDINDNAPEITIKSLLTPIPEDSEPGTLIALINVNDQDSGENGDVTCQITELFPFELIASSNSYYKLVTTSLMDRETISMYNITIIAQDEGTPQMSTKKIINLVLSDINDNPPVFNKPRYIVYIPENNTPGSSILNVQASDLDDGPNAQVLYSLINTNINDIPVSSYVSINLESGVLYSQRSFDYEQLREFQVMIKAKDRGSPPLSNNVTVRICIIDQNDNSPRILYPSPDTEGTALFEFIPRSSEKDYLVTKVIAVDADSGHNAWLSYHILQVPDSSFFTIGQLTGEIKIARDLQDTDSLRQKIVIMVKDNGVPSLSATVNLNLFVAENFQQGLPEVVRQPSASDSSSNVTFYLVIAITLISLLFIVTVVVTVIAKCRKSNTPTAFGSISRAWYPQLSLKPPSQFSDGSLPIPYSYDVCVTLDSTQNEIAYLRPVQNVPTDNLIDTGDSATGNDSTRNSFTSITLNQTSHELTLHVSCKPLGYLPYFKLTPSFKYVPAVLKFGLSVVLLTNKAEDLYI